MDALSFAISEFNLLVFAVLGGAIFTIFRLLQYALKRLLSKHRYIRSIRRLVPVLEAAVWLVYLIIAIRSIFQQQIMYSLGILVVVLVVVVWVSWFAIRDFVAGIILKFEGSFQEGERIKIADAAGKILNLGYFSLEMENEQGEKINIPYHKVSNAMRVKSETEQRLKSYTFEVATAKELTLPDLLEKVRLILLHAPWSAVVQEPQLSLLEETHEEYKLKVIVYSLDGKYFQKIKSYLQTHLL